MSEEYSYKPNQEAIATLGPTKHKVKVVGKAMIADKLGWIVQFPKASADLDGFDCIVLPGEVLSPVIDNVVHVDFVTGVLKA